MVNLITIFNRSVKSVIQFFFNNSWSQGSRDGGIRKIFFDCVRLKDRFGRQNFRKSGPRWTPDEVHPASPAWNFNNLLRQRLLSIIQSFKKCFYQSFSIALKSRNTVSEKNFHMTPWWKCRISMWTPKYPNTVFVTLWKVSSKIFIIK